MFYKKLIYAVLFLAILSCNGRDRKVHPAFYYWKTILSGNNAENALLQAIAGEYLYVRFFDIDLDMTSGQPVPVGILKAQRLTLDSQKIIPVVYITQKCLLRLSSHDVPALARRMVELVQDMCTRYAIGPEEIQLDCDWTRTTRNLYFALLQELKQQPFLTGRKLSCTIRMHQVKYVSQSGVPPVDRGMLMCYNMGNMKKYGGHNSILETQEAKAYMRDMEQYPLRLDIALPLFHWAVLFADHRFKGIAYDMLPGDFNNDELVQVKDNLYRFTKDTENKGYFFKQGEEIRFEQSRQSELEDIARYAGRHINNNDFRVAFFHLDSTSVNDFSPGDINRILKAF